MKSLPKKLPKVLPHPHLSFETVLLFAVVAVAIAGIVALVWFLRRRRTEAAAGVSEPTAPAVADKAAGEEIARAWRRFVRRLPGRARRSLDQFHPVVLLGPESAGKAEIVERFSGVDHRRAEVGAPAQLTDGDLRLHLGGDILVMELSEEACRARMDTVGGGLRRAFGPALRRRTPVVAVCLSPETLEKRSEQDLRELGGALCAKIALLADLRGEPLEVRVVVPAAKGSQRLDALFLLTQLPGVSPVLPLGLGEEPALRAQLLAFTDLLTEVLATRGSEEALDVVELLEAVPQLSQSLSAFVSELYDGGAGGRIQSGGLYLVPEAGGPNPLEVPAALARPLPHPLIKHRLMSLTIAAAALVWLAVAFVHQRQAWITASDAAGMYDSERPGEDDLRRQIRLYAGAEASASRIDLWLPRYFTEGPSTVGCAFVESIRQKPLLQELSKRICSSAVNAPPELLARCPSSTTFHPAPPEEVLYLLALLYAARDNDLGTLIQHEYEQWADFVLTIPIIQDYLALARPNRNVRLLEDLWSCEYDERTEIFTDVKAFLAPLSQQHPRVTDAAALARQANALPKRLDDRGRFQHAARVLESRTFQQTPLHNYAEAFAPYRSHLELLQELAECRPQLDQVIAIAAEGEPGRNDSPPADLPTLVTRLGAALDGKPDGESIRIDLGSEKFDIDVAALATALRASKVRALIDGFSDNASHDDLTLLGFRDEDANARETLGTRWPQGLAGCDSLPRPYTRGGFDKSVKSQLVALNSLLGQMEDFGTDRDRLQRIVRTAIKHYAADYEASLDDCYDAFRVAKMGTVGLERVLHTLSGDASPFRDFVDDIGRNSTLLADTDEDEFELFKPLREVQAKYEPVAKLLAAGKPAGPLITYLDLLRTALLRLDPAAPTAATQLSPFLTDLSPLGRLSLASLTDPKTSPLELARKWAQDQQLDEDLAAPFLEPLQRLSEQATGELADSVGLLTRELVRRLDADLLSRYPFSPQAADEVDPDQLDEWLNPKHGRLGGIVLAVQPLIRSISTYESPRVWAPSAACSEDVGCVRGLRPLLSVLNDLAPITALLWTEDGKQQPLRFRVLPKPLEAPRDGGPGPAAVHLVAGEGHVDYYNQRPAETALELDWTKPQTSRLSVELPAKDSMTSFDPPTLEVRGTPWSLLRLLQKSTTRGTSRTWEVPAGEGKAVSVSLIVREDATQAFRVHVAGSRRPGWANN